MKCRRVTRGWMIALVFCGLTLSAYGGTGHLTYPMEIDPRTRTIPPEEIIRVLESHLLQMNLDGRYRFEVKEPRVYEKIVLPAGQAVTITFDNQDAGVQHNIAIYADNSLATVLFTGELVTGVASVEYQIPALEAGTYYFQCDVHPNMNGTVTVE